MNRLKLMFLTVAQLFRQVGRLPQMLTQAAEQRQRQKVLDDGEAERLDRIRYPSKYRGK